MADKTKIEWTDATWNPITGCSVVSPGCTNCYAMRLAGTRLKHHPTREGLTTMSKARGVDGEAGQGNKKAKPVWNGTVRFNGSALMDPLRWKRPRMIFVCAHGDLFAEEVPEEWIDQVFAVMALAPQHTFQVLTKRPERMRAYLSSEINCHRIMSLACDNAVEGALNVTLVAAPEFEAAAPPGPRIRLWEWPLRNVWLGVSVEDQKRAVERIMPLLMTPAAIRFASVEPLLGSINLADIDWGDGSLNALSTETWKREIDCWRDTEPAWEASFLDWYNMSEMPDDDDIMHPVLDWVIVGGESGPGARPMHPDWARSLRDQCAAAGVPFFFKQWGEWCPATSEFGVSGHVMPDTGEEFTWIGWDGRQQNPSAHGLEAPVMAIARMGKRAAGRLLDGIEHNAMPAIDRRAA